MENTKYKRPRPVLSGQVTAETAETFRRIAKLTGHNKSQILQQVISVGLPVFIATNKLTEPLEREAA